MATLMPQNESTYVSVSGRQLKWQKDKLKSLTGSLTKFTLHVFVVLFLLFVLITTQRWIVAEVVCSTIGHMKSSGIISASVFQV